MCPDSQQHAPPGALAQYHRATGLGNHTESTGTPVANSYNFVAVQPPLPRQLLPVLGIIESGAENVPQEPLVLSSAHEQFLVQREEKTKQQNATKYQRYYQSKKQKRQANEAKLLEQQVRVLSFRNSK